MHHLSERWAPHTEPCTLSVRYNICRVYTRTHIINISFFKYAFIIIRWLMYLWSARPYPERGSACRQRLKNNVCRGKSFFRLQMYAESYLNYYDTKVKAKRAIELSWIGWNVYWQRFCNRATQRRWDVANEWHCRLLAYYTWIIYAGGTPRKLMIGFAKVEVFMRNAWCPSGSENWEELTIYLQLDLCARSLLGVGVRKTVDT